MKLSDKELSYTSLPVCQQKTIITGKGKVIIGSNCKFGYIIGGFNRGGSIELHARYNQAVIEIGNKVATNNNIFVCCANSIRIGNECRIGQNVTIMDFEAHGTDPKKRSRIGMVGNIIISNNVWIGNNVTILKNSEIGENSIVATGAVVSGKFPRNVIIGGIPARIIKHIDGDES